MQMLAIKQNPVQIRRQLLLQYQEQSKELDVTFVCDDGEQRCNRLVLNHTSEFFTEQLNGREKLGNELKFTYAFSKQCVKTFLDLMHGVKLTTIELHTALELIKFIKYEGKDASDGFEKDLLEMLSTALKDALLTTPTKLLICLICNSFDNYQYDFGKCFFKDCDEKDLKLTCFDIDLKSPGNIKLKSLIATNDQDDDVQSKIFLMVKSMKLVVTTAPKFTFGSSSSPTFTQNKGAKSLFGGFGDSK